MLNNRTTVEDGLDQALRRRGVVILSAFAFVWATTGALALPEWSVLGVAAPALIAATVAATALRVQVSTRHSERPDGWQRTFHAVGLVQAVAIGVAVAALLALGEPEAIPAVVCLVVGLHFLPLRRVFDQWQYGGTATALIVVAALGMMLLPVSGPEASRATVGFGAAVSLLLTALSLTMKGGRQR